MTTRQKATQIIKWLRDEEIEVESITGSTIQFSKNDWLFSLLCDELNITYQRHTIYYCILDDLYNGLNAYKRKDKINDLLQ